MLSLPLTGLVFFLQTSAFPGEVVLASSPHVDLRVGFRVVDRQLEKVDADLIFVDGDSLVAWSAVVGVPSGFIEHVWSKDGVEVARHYLPVGSNRRWRTWSRVSVSAGEWQVRVIGPDGTALGKTTFSVAELGTPDDC